MGSNRDGRWRALVLVGSLALLVGCGSGGDDPATAAPDGGAGAPAMPADAVGSEEAPAVNGIRLSFRVNPQLTTGLYMGERWVSPPRFTMFFSGDALSVKARSHAADAPGNLADVSATWLPAAPDMVAVAPEQGQEVTLTIRREGTSLLTVAHGESSRTLTITAVHDAGVWRVDIVQ